MHRIDKTLWVGQEQSGWGVIALTLRTSAQPVAQAMPGSQHLRVKLRTRIMQSRAGLLALFDSAPLQAAL
jgi:hypothetical protein